MITRIEKETTYDKRYRIYVDDKPLFSIHEDVLVKLRIHKGMSVDKEQLKHILKEEDRNRVRVAAYHYLSYKPRTMYEVRQYLLQKKENEKQIESVIADLVKKGYINDQQYAIQWTKDKRKLKGWGHFRLKQELERKGIAASWIQEALAEDKEEEYRRASEKAVKRYQRLCNEPWIKIERKLGTYLLREGFSSESIYRILSDLRSSLRDEGKE